MATKTPWSPAPQNSNFPGVNGVRRNMTEEAATEVSTIYIAKFAIKNIVTPH